MKHFIVVTIIFSAVIVVEFYNVEPSLRKALYNSLLVSAGYIAFHVINFINKNGNE